MPELNIFAKLSALIAVCCLSFAFGYRRGKSNKQNGYESGSASTKRGA